jgi:hypothetical protein
MAGRALTILAIVVLIGAAIGVYLIKQAPTAQDDENAVRALVIEFGTKLKDVSLLGPTASEDIQNVYRPYATSVLITKWQNTLSDAPGRTTSSPWPDRIEVASVTKENSDQYRVEGVIVEVTNEGGGINEAPTEAVRRPVMLTVSREGDAWKISDLTLGAYPGDGEWELTEPNSQGIQFMYPKSLPTTFISAQEWPPLVELVANAYTCKEGPITAADGPLKESKKHMVGDREYCVTLSSEGAAGSTFRSYEYSTDQGDFVARVVFTLRFPQCLNYDEPQASACAAEQSSFDIDGLVDRNEQSIRKQ